MKSGSKGENNDDEIIKNILYVVNNQYILWGTIQKCKMSNVSHVFKLQDVISDQTYVLFKKHMREKYLQIL